MSRTEISAAPGLPFIDMTREVDAPRDVVFRAFTDPDLVVQWLGPRRYRMTIDEWDVRDGGRWRYAHSDDESSHRFHGVFHGNPSPDGMVQTFEYEGAPGHVSLDTLVLEERGGRTIIRTHSVFQSVEARDAMIEAGMAVGVDEGYERLDELAARLVPVA